MARRRRPTNGGRWRCRQVVLHGGLRLLALIPNKCTITHCGSDKADVWLRRQVRVWPTGLAAVGALDRFLAIVGEDDTRLLAAMNLWFPGKFASNQVDGAAVFDERLGEPEDIDEDGACRSPIASRSRRWSLRGKDQFRSSRGTNCSPSSLEMVQDFWPLCAFTVPVRSADLAKCSGANAI